MNTYEILYSKSVHSLCNTLLHIDHSYNPRSIISSLIIGNTENASYISVINTSRSSFVRLGYVEFQFAAIDSNTRSVIYKCILSDDKNKNNVIMFVVLRNTINKQHKSEGQILFTPIRKSCVTNIEYYNTIYYENLSPLELSAPVLQLHTPACGVIRPYYSYY